MYTGGMITARNQDRARPEFDVGDTVTIVSGRHRTVTSVKGITQVSPALHFTDITYHLASGDSTTARCILESTWYTPWLAEREPGAVKAEEDPTPWCHYCGSMTKKGCHCGPLAPTR